MSNTDETLKYTYAVTNSDWEYDSAQTNNTFLDKFHALFTTLEEDLQGFLQEQQLAVEKTTAAAEQLVAVELPDLGNGGNEPSKPDNGGDDAPVVTVVDSGSCGDTVTWTLTSDGVLTISGTGKTNNYTTATSRNPQIAPWHDYREQITAVKVESGVTYLGSLLFYDLTSLKDVEIADSVTVLGSSLFYGCTALEEVVLPDSIIIEADTPTSYGVFNGCTSLTKVTLPAGLGQISDDFFNGCTSLTNLTIPGSVTYIGIAAFDGCKSLTDIYFEGTVTEWAKVTIEDIDNDPLKAATVHCAQSEPDTTPVVSVVANGDCGDTVTWTLTDDGVLTLSGTGRTNSYSYQKHATWYDYREQITTVKVESGVAHLGDCIFYGLTSLKNVEIADTVVELGSSVFTKCTALEEIVLPDSIDIAANTFGSFGVFEDCTSLTKVTLPAGLTEIPDEFFSGCTSLASLTIPGSVTYVGPSAFSKCTSLTDIDYQGTAAAWAKISIDKSNTALLAATVHFAQ